MTALSTLRAYTPAEQKIVKAVATSFRSNPEFNTEEAILNLGTGEALISFVNEKGEPGIVQKATILPPQSQMGAIDDSTRLMVMNQSTFRGKYDTSIDRETAYEKIKAEMENAEKEALKQKEEKEKAKENGSGKSGISGGKQKKTAAEKAIEKTANAALGTIGRKLGNAIFKGFFK